MQGPGLFARQLRVHPGALPGSVRCGARPWLTAALRGRFRRYSGGRFVHCTMPARLRTFSTIIAVPRGCPVARDLHLCCQILPDPSRHCQRRQRRCLPGGGGGGHGVGAEMFRSLRQEDGVHEVRLFGNSDCTGLALAADLEAFPAATIAEHGIDKAFDHDIRSGWHSECPEHPDPSKYFIKFKANAGLKCIKVSQSSTAGCKTIKVFKNQTEVSATGGLLRLHLVPEVVFEERKTWELKCLKHFDEANDGKGCRWQVNEVEAFYNGECTHAAPVASISGKPKDGDINKAFDADLGTKWTPSCAELPNQYAISFQASADLQCIKISQVPNVGCRTISVVRDGVEVARMRGLMKTKEPEPVLKIFKVALATGAKASHHFVKYGGQQCSGTGIGGISGQPGDAVSCLSKCLDTPSCVAFVIVHTGKHAGKCFFRSDLQLAVGAEEYTGDKRDCYIRQKVFAGAAAVMAIPSSGVCTTQCAPGYGPSVPSLSCSVGSLQPADFECKPEPCKAPEVANAASSGSCKEGANVLSGSTCTPQCSEGYLPSLDSLACHAGSLTPATFVCSGPCTPPTASKLLSYSCRELEDDPTGKIPHGSACTPICELGYVPAPSTLNCNNGNFDQAVKCQHDKPAEAKGQQIQFGWSGDPHYRGFNVRGRGGDADVYPGCHWVLKMECPNIPNWIWVQGLYGPRKPAVTMGMGFGGHFLRKNVLTIQAAREDDAKCWNVRWNGMDVTDPKSGWKQDKAQANSYEFDLDGGTGADDNMIDDVNWPSCNSVSAGLGYGLKYSASRNSWDREDNIGVSGQFYQDKYANQNLESFFCLNGKVEGESRTLDGETGGTGQLFVPVELDFFATPQTAIAAKLEELSEPAEMKKRHNQPTASPRGTKLTMGLLEDQELGLSEDGTMITTRTGTTTALQCTGEVLKKAHESCDALAKDKQEGEDDHDNDVKKAMLQSCIYDVCVTALKGFGKTYKEDEELYDEESALRHRMNFTMVGQGKACEEGHKKTTEVNDITLSEREKERLAAAKGNCTGPCEICMPGVRKYLVGSTVRHNETLQSCEAQRLAMPKTEADQKRLHTQQKKRSQTAKGWLGGHFHDGGWQWDDDTELKDTFVEDGQEGDYLCMDRGSGSLVNCNHNNGTLHDGLCEVQFHYPGMDEPVEEEVMTG
ncbi:unnamed protein product [Effrenium voratum]|uniref:Uncharacterized protein n=1 Tax=Effrenium voratum TaxID=2562239 RepID=A0AA36JT59_9DINO|nr:unnamed protein product [Effrenium voratum]